MVLHDTCASAIHLSELELGFPVSLVRRQAIPSDRLSIVLRDACPVVVLHPEVMLGARVPLVGREAIPACGFCVVLRDTRTGDIQPSEIELCGGVSLCRSRP
jgi:hypothetical protein